MATPDSLPSLCSRLQASDRAAFETVFREMRDDLLRYVGSIVRDDIISHDLVQDVFVSLWGGRTSLDPARPIKPYVYRMARNRALRHLRDSRTHAEKQELFRYEVRTTESSAPMENRLDQATLERHLHRWVADLPQRQQEALMLSRNHKLSHREIAAVMEISPRTVNVHITRALDTLQQRLHTFETTSESS